MNSRLPLASAVSVLVLLAAGCASSDDSNPPSDGESTAALQGTGLTDPDTCTEDKVGGDASFGAYVDGAGLDPAAPQSNQGGMQQAAIFGTLMRYDYDTATYEPSTAESLEPNGDYTQWTLKLRDGRDVR